MIHAGQCLPLGVEAGDDGLRIQAWTQDFKRDILLQPRMHGAINRSHTAVAQFFLKSVAVDHRAGLGSIADDGGGPERLRERRKSTRVFGRRRCFPGISTVVEFDAHQFAEQLRSLWILDVAEICLDRGLSTALPCQFERVADLFLRTDLAAQCVQTASVD